jgi:sec-independent protein translocase protein TatC
MASTLRPISHEARLSIVDHLDELRSRMILCGVVLTVAFAVCFWQNHALLNVLNRALPHPSSQGLAAVPKETAIERRGIKEAALAAAALAQSPGLPAGVRAQEAREAQGLQLAAKALPSQEPVKEKPITLGVGEPFTTTLTVAAYFALLFSLPLLIYQGYAFVIPALNPNERRVALPVMASAPLLFLLGVAFAYEIVLPPAVHFLQGFNSSNFDILVQAKAYYTFEILTMLGIGLAFQLPLGLLGLDRIGIINSGTLTRNWRYCVVLIAIVAAAMPGADPVTTGLEMLPLILLYLLSIVLLRFADRRAAARAAAEMSTFDPPDLPT